MTTLSTRALVSLFTVLIPIACTSRTPAAQSPSVAPAAERVPDPGFAFDNDARQRVHVYLVSPQRQWLLGRVEPGTRAWLRLPTRAMGSEGGMVRLVVIENASVTLQAARDPYAVQSMAQPAVSLLDRQWSFSQNQLKSLLIAPTATTR